MMNEKCNSCKYYYAEYIRIYHGVVEACCNYGNQVVGNLSCFEPATDKHNVVDKGR